MIFYWINRIILGDTLFGIAAFISCAIAVLLPSFSKKWAGWVKFLYAVAIYLCLLVLSHYAIDALQNFWCCSHPFGEPLNIQK